MGGYDLSTSIGCLSGRNAPQFCTEAVDLGRESAILDEHSDSTPSNGATITRCSSKICHKQKKDNH